MENEGRKIMHHPAFRASVTCVRVPVYRAHSVAVTAEFERPVTVEAARAVLSKAPGLDVVDSPEKKEYPLPLVRGGKIQLPGRANSPGLRHGEWPLLLGIRRSTAQRRRAERRADRRRTAEIVEAASRQSRPPSPDTLRALKRAGQPRARKRMAFTPLRSDVLVVYVEYRQALLTITSRELKSRKTLTASDARFTARFGNTPK